MRKRELELPLHDLYYPSDIVSYSFIDRAQHMVASMLSAQVQEASADIAVADGRSLAVHPRCENKRTGSGWNLSGLLVHKGVYVRNPRLLRLVKLVGHPLDAGAGGFGLREEERLTRVCRMNCCCTALAFRRAPCYHAHPAGCAQIDMPFALAPRSGPPG